MLFVITIVDSIRALTHEILAPRILEELDAMVLSGAV